MFVIHEPQWWVNLVLSLNTWMSTSALLTLWIPILADIFVFVYPIYLAIVYCYGIWHRDNFLKESALYVTVSTFFVICVNILVQVFVSKDRPDVVLNLTGSRDAVLLHKYLPPSSFPSDHAAVSMAVAMATLIWGIHHNKKGYIWFGLFLLLISLIMCFARITTALHWPTDIIAGFVVGTVVPMLVLWSPTWIRTKKRIVHPLMRLQVWLWGVVWLRG